MSKKEITVEQVIEFLELKLQKQEEYLDARDKQILIYTWDNIPYEKMQIVGYSNGFIKTNAAPKLWQKISSILQEEQLIPSEFNITKKNFRAEMTEIVKLHHPINLINKTIDGRFKILNLKSQGIMGNSYIGEHLPSGQNKCLIKQLRICQNENTRIQFSREVNALYQLRWHPQIPSLIDHCEDETGYYVVYEYIEGIPLSNKLSEEAPSKPWSEAKTIAIITSILKVLKYIHERNIIHRDIKPSNLIEKFNGDIILINFGSVKDLTTKTDTRERDCRSGFPGTRGYSSPEVPFGTPDPSSDIFSLGMLGVQAVTGLPPTLIDYKREVVWDEGVCISSDFKNILNKMTAYYDKERYQSADAVLDDLQKIWAFQKRSLGFIYGQK